MKSKTRTIITSEADEALLQAICTLYPLVSPHRVAQVSLRCGLRAIAADPKRLVREAQEEGGQP